MNYDFDKLNWLMGYLAGQLDMSGLDDFTNTMLAFRSFYGQDKLSMVDFLVKLKERFAQAKWKIVFIPGFKSDDVSITLNSHPLFLNIFQNYSNLMPFYCPIDADLPVLETDRLFGAMEAIIYHLSELPLLYVFNDHEEYFYKIDSRQTLMDIVEELQCNRIEESAKLNDSGKMAYFIQLSDFHCGSKKKENYREILLHLLDQQIAVLKTKYAIKFLITGDLMDSPSRKNMYQASAFLNELKRRYHADVQFVLGNHDMVVKGLNIFRRQKAKVVAYILGENVHVLEDVKVVLIKLNSSLHGNFARGMIGERQLQEIDDELSTIPNLGEYTPFVMVHHHILPVQKAAFLKTTWKEKFIVGKVMDKSKALIDGELLLEWMKERHIHYAFHGHKHIPGLNCTGNIYLMGAGSSSGVMKDDSDRYLSYNLIQYDVFKQKIVACTLFYEDEKGLLPKHIYTEYFKEDIK